MFFVGSRVVPEERSDGQEGRRKRTIGHLFVEHVAVAAALSQGASLLAQNKVPEEVMDAIRGSLTVILKFLEPKIAEHRVLFERIPLVPDTQSVWLCVSFSADARANFHLRTVNPNLTDLFAAAHDDCVWECLYRTLKSPPLAEQSSLV